MSPEPHLLTNAYCKTDRAKVHLDELKAEIDSFLKSNPYTISYQDEPERDAVRYQIVVRQPHIGIYLIAADVLQCLRTALDQAVWSLVRLADPDPDADPSNTEFPIFTEAPLDRKSRSRFDSKLGNMGMEARKFIESLQPYKRPAGAPLSAHLLWQLHELNRIDKHRRILVSATINVTARTTFSAMVDPDFAIPPEITPTGQNTYDVVYLGRYKHLKPSVAPLIMFGEPKTVRISIDGIEQIYDFVTETILPGLGGCAQ